jgi:hypothetical protein
VTSTPEDRRIECRNTIGCLEVFLLWRHGWRKDGVHKRLAKKHSPLQENIL